MAETFDKVNMSSAVQATKVINIKLCEDELFHINNEISLTTHDNDTLLFNGDQLDFILRPEEYDIHILGVDINGVFINTINFLIEKGYNVTVYSDSIRPYSKKTILHIKNTGVKFTSIKSISLV
ncbi:MAG: hypothetical protein KBF89_08515 [Acidimicrobiia bacterium]|nr:hypothetical protein [Acidimicrobiia bacterium]